VTLFEKRQRNAQTGVTALTALMDLGKHVENAIDLIGGNANPRNRIW
jgi:hypothetical protein